MRRFRIVVFWIVVFWCFAAAISVFPLSVSAGMPDITIGVNMELSSWLAPYGESTLAGIRLAVEQANNSGTLPVSIKLVDIDNGSSGEQSADTAKALIEHYGAIALIGPIVSAYSESAAIIAQAHNTPMISPVATDISISSVSEYYYRACALDLLQGYAMAEFAYKVIGARRAATLTNNSDSYSLALTESFKNRFITLGGKVSAEETYWTGERDYASQLSNIIDANVDIIYVPSFNDELRLIMHQARQLGITASFAGGDEWDSTKLTEVIDTEYPNDVFYTTHFSPYDPSVGVQDFVLRYKEKYGVIPDTLAALGYDTAAILIDAIKRTQLLSPEGIRYALSQTNYSGLTGDISFDKYGNAIKPLIIIELKNDSRYVSRIDKPDQAVWSDIVSEWLSYSQESLPSDAFGEESDPWPAIYRRLDDVDKSIWAASAKTNLAWPYQDGGMVQLFAADYKDILTENELNTLRFEPGLPYTAILVRLENETDEKLLIGPTYCVLVDSRGEMHKCHTALDIVSDELNGKTDWNANPFTVFPYDLYDLAPGARVYLHFGFTNVELIKQLVWEDYNYKVILKWK